MFDIYKPKRETEDDYGDVTTYCDYCKRELNSDETVYIDGDIMCMECFDKMLRDDYESSVGEDLIKYLTDYNEAHPDKPRSDGLQYVKDAVAEDDYDYIFSEFRDEICEIYGLDAFSTVSDVAWSAYEDYDDGPDPDFAHDEYANGDYDY